MKARPAIVIGLGSSGSEVVVEIYKNYKKFLATNPDVNPNIMQFLLIDSDIPGNDAQALRATNSILPVGEPNGDALYKNMWNLDPFFRVWWPDNYRNVGPMWPGCSTISVKGRLAFWSKLGMKQLEDNIFKLLKDMINVAGAAAGASKEDRMQVPWVPVFLISTICGGTGAGMTLDIAYILKQLKDTSAEVHGILMMPSVPTLRAEVPFHQHIRANGYGFLVALNHWMTEAENRKAEITPFMERLGEQLSGELSPFDLVWLISAKNKDSFSLLDWHSIKMHLSIAVSSMLLEDTENFQSNLSNLIRDAKLGNKYGQPFAYGSFAAYSLRYQPDKTAEYLANYYGQQALQAFQQTSPEGLDYAKLTASKFLRERHIREKSEEDPTQAMDEVINRLQLVTSARAVYEDLNFDQRLSQKSKKDKATLFEELKALRNEETARLTAHDKSLAGLCFKENLEANLKELVEETLNTRLGQRAEISGLYQTVEWMLEDYKDGLARTESFLIELLTSLESHRADLQAELDGDPIANRAGEIKTIYEMESEETLEQLASKAARLMFEGFLHDRRKGIDLIKKQFLNEWVSSKKKILAKQMGITFYDIMIRSVSDLKNNLLERLRKDLDNVAIDMSSQGREALGRRLGVREATLEDLVLQDEKALLKFFGNDRQDMSSEGRKIVASHVIRYISEIKTKRAPQEVEGVRQNFRKSLQKELVEAGLMVFTPVAEDLTVWDALKVEADFKYKDTTTYIQERVYNVISKCIPYWPINTQGMKAMGVFPAPMTLFSLDVDVMHNFEARNKIDLGLDKVVAKASNDLNGRSAMFASKYEFNIFKAEAGIPLFFHNEVSDCEPDFKNWRSAQSTVPVLLDKRLENVLDASGDRVFDLVREDPYMESEYMFLVAEGLNYITTPLNTSEGVRTNGLHQFEATTILNGARRDAIKALQKGGSAEKVMQKINEKVRKFWNKKGEDDKIQVLVETYAKLIKAAKSSASEFKQQLQKQADLVSRQAEKEFNIDQTTLAEKAQEYWDEIIAAEKQKEAAKPATPSAKTPRPKAGSTK